MMNARLTAGWGAWADLWRAKSYAMKRLREAANRLRKGRVGASCRGGADARTQDEGFNEVELGARDRKYFVQFNFVACSSSSGSELASSGNSKR